MQTSARAAVYDSHDSQRFVAEEKKSPIRTHFERDRARVMYSSALRRLGAKTQVLGPATDDFIRTRLTHSLEVSQVGRVLAKSLGCDPDVVDTACLAHDLGHPPFGHHGETTLNNLAASIGGFEGNAQTFRLLVRLEPKIVDGGGRPAGLNLTRASLDAVSKYPWAKGEGPDREKSLRKYSVYDDDKRVFQWMREGAPSGIRCLEAQLMDISDDIAYSVHDVEDCIQLHFAHPRVLRDAAQRQRIWEKGRKWYGDRFSSDQLDEAASRLIEEGLWIGDYDDSYASAAHLKDMTSQLIGRFCEGVHDATRAAYGDEPLHRYDCALVVPDHIQAEILVLKSIAVEYVMAPRETEPSFKDEHSTLCELVDVYDDSRGAKLDEPFRAMYMRADDDAGRLRAIIDNVASMTDITAQQKHASLKGMFSGL